MLIRCFRSNQVFLYMKKICSKCNAEKESSEFYQTKSKGTGQAYCKICFNKYVSQRWINKKIKAIKYLGSKCNDCPISFPEYPYVVFDFHHLDPTQKDFDWHQLRLRSETIFIKELNKCILLCSNCHRVRHHNLFVPLTGIEPVSNH